MTIGELAQLFNEHFGIGAKLEVVTMQGWSRDQYFDETGLPWVLPSPNMPTLDSAIVYPGTVLLEGTNVSEGRGTTRPFELVGAPWVDPDAFAAGLNALRPARRALPPALFEPTFHKHAGTLVRRLPDSRDRSHDVRAGRDRRRDHRRVPPRGTRSVRVARPAVRVRVHEAADRHPVRIRRAARRPGRGPDDGRSGRGHAARKPRRSSNERRRWLLY